MIPRTDLILATLQRKIANSDAVDLTAPRNNIGEWFFKEGNEWKYFCVTLEDEIRPDDVKVFGATAIPADIYELKISFSNRFKRNMVELVPTFQYNPNKTFSGLRAHGGNTAEDTHGCILVAKNYDADKKKIFASMEKELLERVTKLTALNSHVYLKIENKQLSSNDQLNQKFLA